MAIVFDPNQARVDEAYRTESMNLYKKGELEISEKDLKWLCQVLGESTDGNEYVIEDDITSNEKKSPKVEHDKVSKTNGVVDLAISGGAMGSATVIGLNAASGLTGPAAQMAGTNTLATPIACITAFAIGSKYEITRPYKKEHNELETLKEAMETGNLEIANSLINIQSAEEDIETLGNESDEINTNTEEELQTLIEEIEKKQVRIDELNAKSETEEGLTDEEKSELEDLTGEVTELQGKAGELKEKAVSDVEDRKDKIESTQSGIDEANNIFNSVLEVADYAETFDEDTHGATTLESVAQGVNAAMGYAAAANLTFHPGLILTGYGEVLRGLALAGAGMSTHGTIEQATFAKDIGEEIDVRTITQTDGESGLEEVEVVTKNVEDNIILADDIVKNIAEDGGEVGDGIVPANGEPQVDVPLVPDFPSEPEPDKNPFDKKDPDKKD